MDGSSSYSQSVSLFIDAATLRLWKLDLMLVGPHTHTHRGRNYLPLEFFNRESHVDISCLDRLRLLRIAGLRHRV